MKRSVVVFVAALASVAIGQTCALAQGKPAPKAEKQPAGGVETQAKPPAVDPAALALVKAMSDKLAAAKSVSFVARGAFDVPARNGQPLFYFTRSEILLVRPNKLRVIVPGDGPPSEFYYDGKTIAVFQPYSDFIATMDAPGTLDDALEAVYQKAGLYFPFVDFIVADPYKTLTTGLTSAFVIGTSDLVGNTRTDILSLSNKNVHVQLWIGAEDHLPRLVWATPVDQAKELRHMVEFSDWRLDGHVPAATAFTAKTTQSTKQIPFARPESRAEKKH